RAGVARRASRAGAALDVRGVGGRGWGGQAPRRQVYVGSVDGGRFRLVVGRTGGPYDLAWSPTGRALAFVSDRHMEVVTTSAHPRRWVVPLPASWRRSGFDELA